MIIWASSRQGRKGGVVTDWVKRHAQNDSRFEIDFVDLRELELPFFDEPISPFSMKSAGTDYQNLNGKAWAQRVAKADAVLIITPEYNHGYTAVLKNALDWVGPEWADKPVGFISYGGISGGARVVEQLRTVTIELGLVQVANPIHFVYFASQFDESGEPKETEKYNGQLNKMFDELNRLHNIFSS